ncbi:MAG: hypothetical protein U9R23_04020 [Candidatus Cloacimonadota bacterium]|nr:hypothetical protein [Candidatus Cloacimonadota bacterium]
MKRVLVEINDDSYNKFLDTISKLPDDKIRFWEEIDKDDFFTADDNKVYQKAIEELKKGRAISLNKIKKELNV